VDELPPSVREASDVSPGCGVSHRRIDFHHPHARSKRMDGDADFGTVAA
jgi:hypothetical protein